MKPFLVMYDDNQCVFLLDLAKAMMHALSSVYLTLAKTLFNRCQIVLG